MKNNNSPKITVIMPTYNRCNMLKEALQSILNQTFKDFELIVIDDCSNDGTQEYLTEQAQKDSRIIYIRNKKNMHYNYGLRLGCKLAKGEYIARMDDDDVSMPTRFEKQVKFLDHNPDIAVVGSFIEIFGIDNPPLKNWVDSSTPEDLSIDIFYKCPLCHPSVMIRRSFLTQKKIGYNKKALYAEDTMLWIDIILAGGKLANIPEVLLKYRVGHTRVSSEKDTNLVQNKTVFKARYKLWRNYFNYFKAKELSKISVYPRLTGNNVSLIYAFLQIAEKNCKKLPRENIYNYLTKHGVKAEQMNICFAGNNAISVQMCVAITSIVRTMRNFDTINFFILENDISKKNKKKIKKLEKENVSIEFIRINAQEFEAKCPKGQGCVHVPVQTYFRYIIPQLKPEYDKVLYLDCDMVVRKPLIDLWNIELGNNYAAAVQEFYFDASNRMKIKVPIVFNAGMLLLNNKKLVEDGIADILFINTEKFKDKIVYVDQDILNYTFNNKVIWVDPIYNAQIDLWRPGTCAKSIYSQQQMQQAQTNPVIVHYNGPNKPWKEDGLRELKQYQPFIKCYFNNLLHSPYRFRYIKTKIKDFLYKRTETEDFVATKCIFFKFKKNKPFKPSSINYVNSKVWWIDKQIAELNEKINYIKLCSWKVEKACLEKNIPRLMDRINEFGDVTDALYHNEYESHNLKNFSLDYKQIANKENFLKLFNGLDDNSKSIITKILKRIELVEKVNYQPIDLYTAKEKVFINNIKKDFWQNILKIDDHIYSYKHYLLPKDDFEIDVFYEKYGLNLVNKSKFCNKDIIDGGAYIGDSSLLLQEYTNGQVYAFEPEKENYQLLKQTIDLNNASRIIPLQMGLSADSNKYKLSSDGLASTIVQNNHMSNKIENITTISIDKFVEKNKLSVGLIKLDVEGFEQQVLHGAQQTIQTQRPTLLISIYHNADDFFSIKPWIENLNLGYRFKLFKPTNTAILAGLLLIAESDN